MSQKHGRRAANIQLGFPSSSKSGMVQIKRQQERIEL